MYKKTQPSDTFKNIFDNTFSFFSFRAQTRGQQWKERIKSNLMLKLQPFFVTF